MNVALLGAAARNVSKTGPLPAKRNGIWGSRAAASSNTSTPFSCLMRPEKAAYWPPAPDSRRNEFDHVRQDDHAVLGKPLVQQASLRKVAQHDLDRHVVVEESHFARCRTARGVRHAFGQILAAISQHAPVFAAPGALLANTPFVQMADDRAREHVIVIGHYDRHARLAASHEHRGGKERIEIVHVNHVGPIVFEKPRHFAPGRAVVDPGNKTANLADQVPIKPFAGAHQQPGVAAVLFDDARDHLHDPGFAAEALR